MASTFVAISVPPLSVPTSGRTRWHGCVAGIHVLNAALKQDVDGWNKSSHDGSALHWAVRLLCRQHRAFAPGAYQAAGHGAGMLAALEDWRAGDHRRFIALD